MSSQPNSRKCKISASDDDLQDVNTMKNSDKEKEGYAKILTGSEVAQS